MIVATQSEEHEPVLLRPLVAEYTSEQKPVQDNAFGVKTHIVHKVTTL